jgi:hypothetical protein
VSELIAAAALGFAALWYSRAVQAESRVRETAQLLLTAERAWGSRHQQAMADNDRRGEQLAAGTLCDIVRARVATEAHHGR